MGLTKRLTSSGGRANCSWAGGGEPQLALSSCIALGRRQEPERKLDTANATSTNASVSGAELPQLANVWAFSADNLNRAPAPAASRRPVLEPKISNGNFLLVPPLEPEWYLGGLTTPCSSFQLFSQASYRRAFDRGQAASPAPSALPNIREPPWGSRRAGTTWNGIVQG